MPKRALRPCNQPGCPNLSDQSYCPDHAKVPERRRGSAYNRGYNYKWSLYSKRFLRLNPLCACAECAELPVPMIAEVTDHIIPHKGDQALFWDKDNHQPMAKRCHDKKTATTDGGFGR